MGAKTMQITKTETLPILSWDDLDKYEKDDMRHILMVKNFELYDYVKIENTLYCVQEDFVTIWDSKLLRKDWHGIHRISNHAAYLISFNPNFVMQAKIGWMSLELEES